MSSTDIFAFSKSMLNSFLYADIGPRDGAGTLTVASLFGRRGRDPWDEAARLTRLPHEAAVASLAGMIADAPASPLSLQDATPMAERLVALLPQAGAASSPPRPPISRLSTCVLGVALATIIVVGWLAVAAVSAPRNPTDLTGLVNPFGRETLR